MFEKNGLVVLKALLQPKGKQNKSVIIYSPSCQSKPVWLFFLRNTKEDILKNFVLTFLGQKQTPLCSTKESKSGLERHEGEKMMREFSIFGWTVPVNAHVGPV